MPQKNKRHYSSSPTAESATSKRPRPGPNPSTHVQANPSAAPPEAAAPEYPASHTIHIVASSKIQAKVRAVLTALSSDPSPETDNVVLLQARAPAANKLISVAEIAKRELERERRPWWSYVGVKGVLVELDPKDSRNSGKQNGSDASQDAELDKTSDAEEEDAFEPLTGQKDRKKVKNVAVMDFYLAIKPVPALRTLYGEQHSEH
ncbi:uncharacterized protein IWZ02DRAFT_120970 [Phyllosticta citriasiana]|uniref:DNA/RNA-binding protein Alba-like domain-containing protein n=1 Tax=Phyllosticta citriasiana TaxID=595635 RepID=A0ABR1KVK8_9PEZI